MKVLFDNSILQDANRGEYRIGVHLILPNRKDWKQKEIECLPTIAKLCREGKIIPYLTEELEAEAFRRPESWPSTIDNLLEGMTFQHAQPSIPRSKWGLSLEQLRDRDHLINHCKRFYVERFAQWKKVQEVHYPDFFHYWTAEENNMDAFLTTDKTFQNYIRDYRLGLRCKIMLPSELVGFMPTGAPLRSDQQSIGRTRGVKTGLLDTHESRCEGCSNQVRYFSAKV